jgi:hypothetical protein
MIVVLGLSAAVVAAIVALALALPCPACQRRRARMRAAYAAWREQRTQRHKEM